MDKTVARAAVVLGAPLLGTRAAIAYLQTGRVTDSVTVAGPDDQTFELRTFSGTAPGTRLPQLLSVAKGELRFIGPEPLPPPHRRFTRRASGDHGHASVVPGIFCTHRLRAHTGLTFEGGADHPQSPTAREPGPWHESHQSLLRGKNVALIVRSVLARTLGGRHDSRLIPDEVHLLGVRIRNASMAEAVHWIADAADGHHGPQVVCFVNPSCLNTAVVDAAYQTILREADLVLADGIGIRIAARLRGFAMRDNVNGTDLFPRLCRRSARDGLPLYFLGAADGVARAAADAMTQRYPQLLVAGAHHGYLADDPELESAVIADINSSGAQILLVGMGTPDQEAWVTRVRERLTVPVVIGVGGLFDFYSGRIPRAPLWVREIGMEWVWRLAQEPGRLWRRYVIGNPLFLWRVWRERKVNGDTITAHQAHSAAA